MAGRLPHCGWPVASRSLLSVTSQVQGGVEVAAEFRTAGAFVVDVRIRGSLLFSVSRAVSGFNPCERRHLFLASRSPTSEPDPFANIRHKVAFSTLLFCLKCPGTGEDSA